MSMSRNVMISYSVNYVTKDFVLGQKRKYIKEQNIIAKKHPLYTIVPFVAKLSMTEEIIEGTYVKSTQI